MPQQATVDLALAERHRVAQGSLAVRMLAEFARAWPVLRPRRLAASRPIWMEVTGEVIRTYALASASLAADYYESARELAQVPGHFPVTIPEPASEEEIRKNLEWSTRRLWIPEPRAEQIEATRADAEGASTRLVMNGGRGAIAAAVAADRQATAWARVAAPTACAFCALLSSRGAIYGQDTVRFEAHNACHCQAVPVFAGQRYEPSEQVREWQRLYEQHAQGHSGDQLRLFRQAIEGRIPEQA